MPPLFSVVIPTFNRSDLFPSAVSSILDQTFPDFEIILSDNCSGDDTREVAQQFKDPRFKYACTPRHYTIADSWEFARKQASGSLILMLSDDDALLSTALQRFAEAAGDFDHDLLFSSVAEYRDLTYPGPDKNSLTCPGFTGLNRLVSADEFVRPLFSLRPAFNMHPSAFVFPKKIADTVENRTGRFFWTNGVEYSTLPIVALLARRIIHIDLPLTVLGRTGKSWGSNIALCNPGQEKIDTFIKDVDHSLQHAPLHNFMPSTLIAEGILTAKHLFPQEFASYTFDEPSYLRATMRELRKRAGLGVDVSAEIHEALTYSSKYPLLERELRQAQGGPEPRKDRLLQSIRSRIARFTAPSLRRRLHMFHVASHLRAGKTGQAFSARGADFRFRNILECARFLGQWISFAPTRS
jgi:glycosyltransferase involved in cell wall biosynthesis